MAIPLGTEVYSNVEAGCYAYDNNFFPAEFKKLQTLYGDTDGASMAVEDKKWLLGDLIGTSLNELKSVGGKNYHKVMASTFNRSTSGLFGWGAGTYVANPSPVWVLEEDLTTDKGASLKAYDARVNAEKIAKAEKERLAALAKKKLLEPTDPTTPKTGNTGTDSKLNITTIIIVVFGFLGLIIGGVLFWKGRQNKLALAQSKTN